VSASAQDQFIRAAGGLGKTNSVPHRLRDEEVAPSASSLDPAGLDPAGLDPAGLSGDNLWKAVSRAGAVCCTRELPDRLRAPSCQAKWQAQSGIWRGSLCKKLHSMQPAFVAKIYTCRQLNSVDRRAIR